MDKYSNEWIQSIFRMRGKCENSRTREILLSQGFKKNFKIINVVGTNGKGSVTTYINDSLIAKGFKVGKFTSPHLFRYNERITINNKEIENDEFFDIVNPFLKTINNESIMFFPITYIAAMMHFFKNDVDYVILEAGVGGLEDPTNVIDGDYGLLTSIDVDHLDWFQTRENIPVDKSGIINEGMKFYLPTFLEQQDKEIFINSANQKNATVIEVDNDASDYQERNKKLASKFLINEFNISDPVIKTPFGRTTLMNRNGFDVILDVAHNLAGIKESILLLKEKNIQYDQVLISLSSNKSDKGIGELFDVPIFIYEHKGPFPKKIKDYNIKGNVVESIKDFYENINKNTLIIGSFYSIGELDV